MRRGTWAGWARHGVGVEYLARPRQSCERGGWGGGGRRGGGCVTTRCCLSSTHESARARAPARARAVQGPCGGAVPQALTRSQVAQGVSVAPWPRPNRVAPWPRPNREGATGRCCSDLPTMSSGSSSSSYTGATLTASAAILARQSWRRKRYLAPERQLLAVVAIGARAAGCLQGRTLRS